MAVSFVLALAALLTGSWWAYHRLWLFTSRRDHGEDRGCGHIRMVPSSWKFAFGIDKLLKPLDAENEKRLPAFYLEEHEKYGDTYGQYAGGQLTIVTRDSRNISSLLSEQFPKFGYGRSRSILGTLTGEGILPEDGELWSASRRLLASELHKPLYPALHTFEPHFQDLLRSIVSNQDSSSPINLRRLLHDYALDTATEVFLGNSTNLLSLPSKSNKEGSRFANAFNEAMRWIEAKKRLETLAWLATTPGMQMSCSKARDALENMIIEAQKQETQSDKKPFTDFIGKTTDLSKARDELMNLLFAARDPNASLLSRLIYALAREPVVLAQVRSEVFSVLGENPDALPCDADLTKMRYLDNVIHETLRLFPAVPLNGRLCSEATTLPAGGGASGEEPILVPKGGLICFSTFACQRSTKCYGDDAMKFRPERWQETDVMTRTSDFTFHPVLGGPRSCLGGSNILVRISSSARMANTSAERFALKLAQYTICRLVQCLNTITIDRAISKAGCDWQEPIKCQIGLTMFPDDVVSVILETR